MAKSDFDADKRRQGYPAKKKVKKFDPNRNHASLENEIMKLEEEKADLKVRLDEKTQLVFELENALKSERAMTEMTQEELKKIKEKALATRIMNMAGVVIGIIGIIIIVANNVTM